MRYTRRLALTFIGCATALPLLLRSGLGDAAGEGVDQSAAKLRCLIADPRLARVLGRGYRARFRAEDHPAVLMRLMRSSLALGDTEPAAWTRDSLLPALDSRVRAEFGGGDTVQIHGWVLARTEARLCALCE